jgi:3-oxo-5-alpha-steroid 4-dehydrogenase 1
VFVTLFFVSAPYGRHTRGGWGLMIPNRLGWLLMEAPAALVMGAFFVLGLDCLTVVQVIFFLLWEAHYVHRAFIYPFTLRGKGKEMPACVAALAFFFNVANGYLNGRYLFALCGGYPVDWLRDPRFLAGMALFIAGYLTNRFADRTLRNLRRPGESEYRIPYGGLYRRISCPNYLGEIVEWIGWAVMTWSPPGLAFAVWTVANLVPRARDHHIWYRESFPDYPPERKALVPGLF